MTKTLQVFGLLYLLFGAAACKKENDIIIKPSDFTKEKREMLGDLVQGAIAQDPVNFPVLPNIPPYDTSVYWYTQRLYDQVTNSLRIDHLATESNRWNIERPWRITILDQEEMNAFITPGGHFYITTGFLKKLETEHELYYIMAFEASLMNERTLLTRLFSEHNTTILDDITNRLPADYDTDAHTVAMTLQNLDFDENEVFNTDEVTADLICSSSVFDRMGLVTLLNRIQNDEEVKWFNNRYFESASRKDYVENLFTPEGCGNFVQNGGYQMHILNVLQ